MNNSQFTECLNHLSTTSDLRRLSNTGRNNHHPKQNERERDWNKWWRGLLLFKYPGKKMTGVKCQTTWLTEWLARGQLQVQKINQQWLLFTKTRGIVFKCLDFTDCYHVAFMDTKLIHLEKLTKGGCRPSRGIHNNEIDPNVYLSLELNWEDINFGEFG